MLPPVAGAIVGAGSFSIDETAELSEGGGGILPAGAGGGGAMKGVSVGLEPSAAATYDVRLIGTGM